MSNSLLLTDIIPSEVLSLLMVHKYSCAKQLKTKKLQLKIKIRKRFFFMVNTFFIFWVVGWLVVVRIISMADFVRATFI